MLELQDKRNKTVDKINHFVAYDAKKNIVIEPSQRDGMEIFRDVDNQPMILETLGYELTYEIVGVCKLVQKPLMRCKRITA